MSQILGKWITNGAITPNKLDSTASYTMGNLVVSQDATVGGGLNVVGAFNSTGDLNATDLILGGELHTGGDATVGGILNVVGDATVNGNLDINGIFAAGTLGGTNLALSGSLSARDGTFGSDNFISPFHNAQIVLNGGTVGDSSATPGLGFKFAASAAPLAAISGIQTSSSANRVGLAFYVHHSVFSPGNLDEVMRIDHNGYVGIGTTTPQTDLHVNGNTALTGNIFPSTGYTTADLGTTVNPFQSLYLSGNLLTSTGSIGIGTTNPVGKLDIWQSAASNNFFLKTYSTTLSDVSILYLTKSHDTSGFAETLNGESLGRIRALGIGTVLSQIYGAEISFLQDGPAGTFVPANINFTTFTATGTPSTVVMDSTGNVGIGTAKPMGKVDVYSNEAGLKESILHNAHMDGISSFSLYSDSGSLSFSMKQNGSNVYDSHTGLYNLSKITCSNDSSGLFINVAPNAPMYFATNNIIRTTLDSSGDYYSKKWADYASGTTMTGLSGGWTGQIQYMAIGSLVFVRLNISGTASGTAFNFTLPAGYSSSESSGMTVGGLVTLNFDGAPSNLPTYGHALITSASTPIVHIYWDPSQSAWTASGNTREVRGCFTYHRTL